MHQIIMKITLSCHFKTTKQTNYCVYGMYGVTKE